MKTNRSITRSQKKYLPWFSLGLIVILSLIIYAVFNIYREQDQYHVVKFSGEGDVMNLSRFYYTAYSENHGKSPGAVLAKKDDLLFFNSFIKFYNDPEKDSIYFQDEKDSVLYVDHEINTIVISSEYNQLPILEKAKAANYKGLESLLFTNDIPDSYLPYLKKIALVKPQINLLFNTDDSISSITSYLSKADFFSPRNVTISLKESQFPLLSKWKETECLYLSFDDSLIADPLPVMTSLSQLVLVENSKTLIAPSFLENNKQIKKVTLINDHDNLAILKPLDKLEELSVMGDDSLDILNLSAFSDRLSSLVLMGTWNHVDSLTNFKKLRWLGLPENTSQRQFNNIVNTLPAVEILEMEGSDLVTDYKSLLPHSNLRGLVVTDSLTDLETLMNLKQLRYLSVEKTGRDSNIITTLSKALPGCVVVPNSGACLGSGWLMLVLPLAFLFAIIISFMAKRKSNES